MRKLATPGPFRTDPRVDWVEQRYRGGVALLERPGSVLPAEAQLEQMCGFTRSPWRSANGVHTPGGWAGGAALWTHQGNRDRSVDMRGFRHSVRPAQERA